MNMKSIYTVKTLPKGKTNWKKIRNMSEKAINEAALTDPDNPPLSPKQLAKFRRVSPPAVINVKAIRHKLHLSQAMFAACFGISKRTIQDWEQGRRTPEGTARILLKIIECEPEAVQRVLIEQSSSNSGRID